MPLLLLFVLIWGGGATAGGLEATPGLQGRKTGADSGMAHTSQDLTGE